MAAGSGMEDIQALIPNVGDEQGRQFGRDHTIGICGEEEPAYEKYKTEYAHREREKEAQRGISYYNATVTNDNQPMQKVTKSLYIVTNLGQLPFMLATEMARTWATKEDSVNTSIIHLYSTH